MQVSVGALLSLLLTNTEVLADITLDSNLGCSDHKLEEFKILRHVRKMNSKIKSLILGRADFNLLRELLGGIPWKSALEGEET